ALRSAFDTALAALDGGDLTTFMTFVSESFLDYGMNKAAFQAELYEELQDPNFQQTYIVLGTGVNGAMGSLTVLWWGDREREVLSFINESGTWKLYGNQEFFEIEARSGYQANASVPDPYWVSLEVEDPGNLIASVAVAGDGIESSIDLHYDAAEQRWHSWSMDYPAQADLSPRWSVKPALPLTYTFTITRTDQAPVDPVTVTVDNFVEVYPMTHAPAQSETVSGNLVFSWTPVPGFSHSIELNDANWNRIWEARDIIDSSITYNGPPLAGGTYYYNIVTSDGDNYSILQTEFIYSATAPTSVSFSGWVRNTANTGVANAQVEAWQLSSDGGVPAPVLIGAAPADGEAGAFTLTGIPAGDMVYLSIPQPSGTDYAPVLSRYMILGENVQARLPYRLFAGTEYTAFGNTAGTGMILGRVVMKDNPSQPVAGATVTVQRWTPDALHPDLFYAQVTSGEDGMYVVKDVPLDDELQQYVLYQVTASHNDYTFEINDNNAVVPVAAGTVTEESFFATAGVQADMLYMRSAGGYQLEFGLRGNITGISSVTVNGPANSGIASFTLPFDYDEYWAVYPSESSFLTAEFPGYYAGDYVFHVVYNDTSSRDITYTFNPGTPMMPLSAGEITVNETLGEVSWNTVTGAAAYYLIITDGLGNEVYNGENQPVLNHSFSLGTLNLNPGDYNVQVVAVDANGNEAYSAPVFFHYGATGPAAPEIISIQLNSAVAAGTYVCAAHQGMFDQGGTVWVLPGQIQGTTTSGAPAMTPFASGPAPLTGVSTGWGGLLTAFTDTDFSNINSTKGSILTQNMPTNANPDAFGASGPINRDFLHLSDAGIPAGAPVVVTIDMKGQLPHLVAVMGDSRPTVTYDPTGSGTLTIASTTFANLNQAGEEFNSVFGFLIVTDPTLGTTPLRIIAQTNHWVGDIFPLLPGWGDPTKRAVPEIGGTIGSITAHCGTTIYGPTGGERSIRIFVPDESRAYIFGESVMAENLFAFVNGGQVDGTLTHDYANFSTTGTWAEFSYSFASPKDATVGVGQAEPEIPGLDQAILALQAMAGMNPSGLSTVRDVDNNGRIGFPEVLYVLQTNAGLRTPLPPVQSVSGTATVTSRAWNDNDGFDFSTETVSQVLSIDVEPYYQWNGADFLVETNIIYMAPGVMAHDMGVVPLSTVTQVPTDGYEYPGIDGFIPLYDLMGHTIAFKFPDGTYAAVEFTLVGYDTDTTGQYLGPWISTFNYKYQPNGTPNF
ncbi:MAG: hypothetical protein M0P57_13885, partial [Syntrophales bacterium]|nr:hypothetical protein [Syntrophales bacterium]